MTECRPGFGRSEPKKSDRSRPKLPLARAKENVWECWMTRHPSATFFEP